MNNLSKFFNHTFWSFFGVIIAIASVLFAYFTYTHEKEPHISIEVINDANVLDLYKSVNNLEIYFQGENIQEQNLNLRIATIRVENNGELNIHQSHYDSEIPWGLTFEKAEIIETRLIDSNSDYLRKHINPIISNTSSVEFSKLIFEKGKNFSLELLYVHKKGIIPNIVSTGKIAGIDNIEVLRILETDNENTFFKEAFHGNALVQGARIFVYLFIAIIIILIIAAISSIYDDLKERRQVSLRTKRVISIFEEHAIEPNDFTRDIIPLYSEGGIRAVSGVISLLRSEKKLLLFLTNTTKEDLSQSPESDRLLNHEEYLNLELNGSSHISLYGNYSRYLSFTFIKKHNLANYTNGELIVDKEKLKTLLKIRALLRKSGSKKESG